MFVVSLVLVASGIVALGHGRAQVAEAAESESVADGGPLPPVLSADGSRH
jgi:hypothetical protein